MPNYLNMVSPTICLFLGQGFLLVQVEVTAASLYSAKDLRCQVEAVFASKLRGADVLQRESPLE